MDGTSISFLDVTLVVRGTRAFFRPYLGGVASGVQDFPGYDDVDGRHEHLLLGCDTATAVARWLCGMSLTA